VRNIRGIKWKISRKGKKTSIFSRSPPFRKISLS